jgi:hypothetical protein
MQPCEVCGGTAVDVNGFCIGCRVFRGQPQPGSAPASPYPTAYELIDPGVAASYTGAADPPPAPYPAEYQQPQPAPRRRSQFVVPLIALSATLIAAIAAIVVVTVVRSGEQRPGPLVDPCVVGDWTQSQRTGDTTADGLNGRITLAGGGATLHTRADGTGAIDYGDGTTYSGTGTLADGGTSVKIALEYTGAISFDYRTNNGAISYSNVVSNAEITQFQDGQAMLAMHVPPDNTPSTYTCTSTALTLHDRGLTSKYIHKA